MLAGYFKIFSSFCSLTKLIDFLCRHICCMVWYVCLFLLYSYSEVNLSSCQLNVRVMKEKFSSCHVPNILGISHYTNWKASLSRKYLQLNLMQIPHTDLKLRGGRPITACKLSSLLISIVYGIGAKLISNWKNSMLY